MKQKAIQSAYLCNLTVRHVFFPVKSGHGNNEKLISTISLRGCSVDEYLRIPHMLKDLLQICATPMFFFIAQSNLFITTLDTKTKFVFTCILI